MVTLEEKRQALTRRATKLIGWLSWPEYADYSGRDSVLHLMKLIDLVIWALERSMPRKDWKHFKLKFIDTRLLLQDSFDTEDAEKITYLECVASLAEILKEYREFILTHDITLVYND